MCDKGCVHIEFRLSSYRVHIVFILHHIYIAIVLRMLLCGVWRRGLQGRAEVCVENLGQAVGDGVCLELEPNFKYSRPLNILEAFAWNLLGCFRDFEP